MPAEHQSTRVRLTREQERELEKLSRKKARLRLKGIRREQRTCFLQRNRFRVTILRDARVLFLVADIGPIAAVEYLDIVDAKILDDPVGVGLVKSLARPGGNITGVSLQARDYSVKWLELLKKQCRICSAWRFCGIRTTPRWPWKLKPCAKRPPHSV